jgi:outer membrane protein assembly factor BamB
MKNSGASQGQSASELISKRIAELAAALLVPWLAACAPVARNDAPGDDWPRFRGPNGSGVSDARPLPERLGPQANLAFKVPLPPGNSSPVVAGGRVFLTAAEGDQRLVLALDAASGKQVWRWAAPKARSEVGNPSMNGPATPTPAVEGDRIFAFFPDTALVTLTGAGKEIWRAPLGPFKSMHGIASSPVAAEGKVFVLVDQLGSSYLAAFDAASGRPIWRADRPSGVTGGYSTPIVQGSGPGALVIAAGALELTAYEAASGRRAWWATGLTSAPIGGPVLDGDRVYVCEPIGEPVPFSQAAEFDKDGDGKISPDELGGDPLMLQFLERLDARFGNGDGVLDESEWKKAFGSMEGNGGMAAVRLGGTGEVTATHVAWRASKPLSHVPTLLLYHQAIFLIRDGGILVSFDPATGKVLKQARLEDAGGSYRASPVAGDGKVILVSESGKVSVVKAQADWEPISSSDLGETTTATPAIAGGRVYVRTARSLYCFSRPSPTPKP